MDIIHFYHNPTSRGRIIHWMLEEIAVPYQVHLLDFNKKEHKDPKYLAINPMGKIPAIVHRGAVVTECAAICSYLADAFPKAQLAPPNEDPSRGTYFRWLFFGAGCFEPAMVDKMLSRPPVDRRGALGYGSYEDTLNALEKAISPGPYILGEKFSAADVYISSQMGWSMMMKSLDPLPVFQSYVARCSERPAFKRYINKSNLLAESM